MDGAELDKQFFTRLLQHTNNFSGLTWLGYPVWQNLFDLWTTQEVIFEVKPSLLIECGSCLGGSAIYYANLFDLMGKGRVISIDIEKQHNFTHPRVEFLIGDSAGPEIVATVRKAVEEAGGPIMVILDSDHSADHVEREFEAYCGFVTVGSYMLVQDGVIDVLDIFAGGRPGPLEAIRRALPRHPEFQVDMIKCNRFLITHHPAGWLKRVS